VSLPAPAHTSRPAFYVIVAVLATLAAGAVAAAAQARRDVDVAARRYAYDVAGSERPEIRVGQGDLVRVTFSAADIAHSFTIDEYRISKRAEPGKPVQFEFRADKPGTFTIYCSLTTDERCREETTGSLVVTPRAAPRR